MNAHKLRNKFFMVCTGKETENMFMMPIDTGNKAIKTENFEFNSGITMLADVPGENEEALREEELTDMIEHRRDEEEAYSADRIDCDFEKIEEVAVDTFTLFDGDIQEFLDGREDTEGILTVKQENTGKM